MAVEVGRGFRSGVRSRGARAEVGYRVEMSIQRSPSRFVRVQRVQGERAREQQSQLWLEGRARDELDGSRTGRRGSGGQGEREGCVKGMDECSRWRSLMLSQGGQRRRKDGSRGRRRAFPARRSVLASLPRQAPTDTSSLRSLSSLVSAPLQLHTRRRVEAQGEHEDLVRPARHKGLARQGARPHVSTPPLPLLNIEDSSYRPLTPVSMGLVQLGCRACAPRRLYHCPPRQRCPRSPRAPRKLHRAARRLSRRQSVVSLFFV